MTFIPSDRVGRIHNFRLGTFIFVPGKNPPPQRQVRRVEDREYRPEPACQRMLQDSTPQWRAHMDELSERILAGEGMGDDLAGLDWREMQGFRAAG